MNIPFTVGTEEIRLTSDDKNFEIRKLKLRNNMVTGNSVEEWQPLLFFGSLEAALLRILTLKVAASTAISLKELRDDVISAREEITTVWSTVTDARGCRCVSKLGVAGLEKT